MPSSRDLAVAVLREPLVHFLVAGALVFLVLSGRPPNATERRIVVDEPVLESIFNRYVQSFHRPPTPEEIDGLVQDYIRSEVYYREALRLGLHAHHAQGAGELACQGVERMSPRSLRTQSIRLASVGPSSSLPTRYDRRRSSRRASPWEEDPCSRLQ